VFDNIKALFSNGSAVLDLRIFFDKGPKIKTFFLDKNSPKKNEKKEKKNFANELGV